MTMKRLLALLLFLITATPALAQLQTAPPPGPQTAPIAAVQLDQPSWISPAGSPGVETTTGPLGQGVAGAKVLSGKIGS